MSFVVTRLPVLRSTSATPAWIAAGASLLLVTALFASGQGTLLRIAIPAGATLVALILYLRRPIGYFHFTLWVWFVTPLIRRLVDWRAGFADHNLVLLTPLLVSAIAGLTVLRERRHAEALRLAPFYLCIASILYGFAVGLIRYRLHTSEAASYGEIGYGLFDWLAPLLFGLHLYIRWRMYEEHKRAFQRTFFWAVLLLGAYGIYQFVSPPAWDTQWLEQVMADGSLSFGRPQTFEIRVWSTLNAPGVFANILVAGLLLLFSSRSRVKFLAAAVGYPAFVLTLVRASWLGWFVGLAVLAKASKGGQIQRLVFSLLLLPALLAPLMLNPQIADLVTQRVQSLQDGGQDTSVQERIEGYRVLMQSLAKDPFGEGLSNTGSFHGQIMDNGFIPLFYYLGWLGAVLFLAGIVLCMRHIPSGGRDGDPIAPLYRALFLSMMFVMFAGNTLIGPSGIVTWMCVGFGFALTKSEQESLSEPEDSVLIVTEPRFPVAVAS